MRKIYLLDFDIANWQWACNHYQPQETGPSLVQGRPCKENLSFPFSLQAILWTTAESCYE